MLLSQRRKRKYLDKGNFDIKISIVTSRASEYTGTVLDSKKLFIIYFHHSQTSRKEDKKKKKEQYLNVYDFWHHVKK